MLYPKQVRGAWRDDRFVAIPDLFFSPLLLGDPQEEKLCTALLTCHFALDVILFQD